MRFHYDFSRRRALITGASSGLGRHFATLLAQQGIAGLALGGRNADRLGEVAEACRLAGAGQVAVIVMDVTDAAAMAPALDHAWQALGGIDLLVNNAGIAKTAKALDTTPAGFDMVLDTNLRGPWLIAVETARRMVAAGVGGDIVNIASILGLRVSNGLASYAISKAGIIQMTRALASEWARHGIRVNALAPGYIETAINKGFFETEAGAAMVRGIPARRIGQIGELDAPFLLLAGAASAYLTGAVLTVDGGHHINPL
ncbi:MAG: SDR family oxidoreductase [Beijerinckiaceae bacterium]|jgi:NAD(P)-dependent dehydrogenase (short-subunit alcohol dehydrogenase family)|nr:SDR family oxidoreductase [Beijerinckiaceae bacterium]